MPHQMQSLRESKILLPTFYLVELRPLPLNHITTLMQFRLKVKLSTRVAGLPELLKISTGGYV